MLLTWAPRWAWDMLPLRSGLRGPVNEDVRWTLDSGSSGTSPSTICSLILAGCDSTAAFIQHVTGVVAVRKHGLEIVRQCHGFRVADEALASVALLEINMLTFSARTPLVSAPSERKRYQALQVQGWFCKEPMDTYDDTLRHAVQVCPEAAVHFRLIILEGLPGQLFDLLLLETIG